MDRREFLRATGGTAAAVAAGLVPLAGAGPARAQPAKRQEARVLRLAMPWRPQVAGPFDEGLRLARRIEASSGGSIRIEIAEPRDGPADLFFGPVAARAGEHPGFAYFAGLPGPDGLGPLDLDGWLAAGGGQALWDGLAAPFGVKPLLAGHSGPDAVFWSKSVMSSPEDFAGKRILVRGLQAEIVRGLGAEPVSVAEDAAERVLAAGELDAAVWGGLVAASAAGVPDLMPFGSRGLLSRAGEAYALEVALPVWMDLDDGTRDVIAAAASAAFRAAVAEKRSSRAFLEAGLKFRSGAGVAAPAAELQAAVDRVAAAVIAHAAGYDHRSAAIDESHMVYARSAATAGYGAGQGLALS